MSASKTKLRTVEFTEVDHQALADELGAHKDDCDFTREESEDGTSHRHTATVNAECQAARVAAAEAAAKAAAEAAGDSSAA